MSARASIRASRVIAYVMPSSESRPMTQVAERSSPSLSPPKAPQAQRHRALVHRFPDLRAHCRDRSRTEPRRYAAGHSAGAATAGSVAAARRDASAASGRSVAAASGRAVAASLRRRRLAEGRCTHDCASTPHRNRAADAGRAFPAVDAKVADVFGLKERGESPIPPARSRSRSATASSRPRCLRRPGLRQPTLIASPTAISPPAITSA